eukprot:gnl/Chilomastix_caulleri/7460.p1 GENE.gnl/Chilomastix_caulleri/7460~~gnl/Chilomastix_caulleri/7460.p1  ORF type:complete len:61 (-),score=9.66 gnl/Chilomastix_caulleri/7460:9-191(-)
MIASLFESMYNNVIGLLPARKAKRHCNKVRGGSQTAQGFHSSGGWQTGTHWASLNSRALR